MKINKMLMQHPLIPFSPLALLLCCLVVMSMPKQVAAQASKYEIYVHAGKHKDSVEYLKSINYWSSSSDPKDLSVPRIILVADSGRWQEESAGMPVDIKKELFYRSILPMVLLANELILEDRQKLASLNDNLLKGKTFSADVQTWLQAIAEKYGLDDVDDPKQLIANLLERVDTIPPSLALGQTAYESGYGTSRFAIEGHALFGQWTYSGKGMKPREHRASKGNYGVAAYKWPFDSVRSYMRNLNTHNAYQGLRDKRAELIRQGKEVTGLALADTLGSYSERGMAYVKTLKSIITVNDLAVADKAYFRDEPITLVIGVKSAEEVENIESKIKQLKASGELSRIIKEMRLDT